VFLGNQLTVAVDDSELVMGFSPIDAAEWSNLEKILCHFTAVKFRRVGMA
jgi:hypothetical protein